MLDTTQEILIGDCRDILKTLPEKSVHCCVTSPPYFNLRSYLPKDHPDKKRELGIEKSPEEYVTNIVEGCREVKRVLRDDGTLWLNLSSSYAGGGRGFGYGGKSDTNRGTKDMPRSIIPTGLKPKDLIPIPWLVALELQKDGWWLRQDLIWSKPNGLPEAVTDRCVKSHEYILLFSKSKKYYFDHFSIQEPAAYDGRKDTFMKGSEKYEFQTDNPAASRKHERWQYNENGLPMRNKRSVWQVNTKPYKGAHFATFNPELITPCILAGTSEHGVCSECGAPYIREIEKTGYSEHGGYRKRADAPGAEVSPSSVFRTGLITTTKTVCWKPSCSCNAPQIPATVLDPFAGSGTVGEVCKNLNRNSLLIELNPDYKHLIEKRIS